ncbi:phosphoglucosamine mutase [Aeoliella sp. ICT_H6.2]|uniref:Phosphoglucosamine mutase n=1 Tax=Aeoliella straminimaris TaxID=2954799 RepID=A0A9X2JHS0_9BACT|nr:phosphoglucosamine mutase [Aeoliella straminimaris]MCO6044923.1 phosphoglucosamine mutase [Aeoliella straminimaris]
MSQLIISVSGLRGIVGETLTPDLAARYLGAFATGLPRGPVMLSYDGRSTGPMLTQAARAALVATGHMVIDAGPCATPTTGVLVRHYHCVGGVQISASHNPAEYNGIKLFGPDGRVIPADEGEHVRRRFETNELQWATYDEVGEIEELADATSAHWDLIEPLVDVQRIRSHRFRVLLDSNHGAGGVLGSHVLEKLGCEVIHLGAEPTGKFLHTPEPTAENLQEVCKLAAKEKVAIAFCQDPDADRLAIIDENGRYVGEEYTLALAVDHVLRQTPGPVVTNCSTSRMTQDLAEKYGVPYHRSAVGEANVVDKMLHEEAVIGGEGNGGVIHPKVVGVRDSMVGMALMLDAMAERDLPISGLVDELPSYAIHKAKVAMPADAVSTATFKLEAHFHSAKPDLMDGLRLDWNDRWLLVRASNTEPIVRIFAEAPTAHEAKQLCDEAATVMKQVL